MNPRKLSDKDRFLLKVNPTPTSTGCLLWIGAISSQGRGNFLIDGKNYGAHRAAWLLFRGPIKDGLCVCHKCNQALCCNLDHLYLDNQDGNRIYMLIQGRARNKRTGKLLPPIVRPHRPTPEERFFAKVQKSSEPNGCDLWMASKGNGNHGIAWWDGRLQPAYRVVWQIANGPIPKGMQVLHTCDNGACVRLGHLWIGTQRDNIHDCQRKGRARKARGEDAGSAKLTAEQVLEIRRLYSPSEYGYRRLAKEFGMSVPHIVHIIQRKKWKHI